MFRRQCLNVVFVTKVLFFWIKFFSFTVRVFLCASISPFFRLGENEREEKFIAPCKCSGSVGVTHRSCLERWLSTSNSDECEICKSFFLVKKCRKSFTQVLSSRPISGWKQFDNTTILYSTWDWISHRGRRLSMLF